MPKMLLIIVVALVSTVSQPVFALEEADECHENAYYAVMKYFRDAAYPDFMIRRKPALRSSSPCSLIIDPEDFRVGDLDKTYKAEGRAYRFVALKDNLLVVERQEGYDGTGIYDTYLLIINLATHESSDELGIHTGIDKVEESRVSFWRRLEIRPTKENCPNNYKYDGDKEDDYAIAYMESRLTFDLSTQKLIKHPVECIVNPGDP